MAKKVKAVAKEAAEDDAGDKQRIEMKKLKDVEVDKLKTKLLEVRTIGQKPLYVTVEKNDTVEDALESAKIQTSNDEEIKVEGLAEGQRLWKPITLATKVFGFEKIAVTTKVAGSN